MLLLLRKLHFQTNETTGAQEQQGKERKKEVSKYLGMRHGKRMLLLQQLFLHIPPFLALINSPTAATAASSPFLHPPPLPVFFFASLSV
jgi:hypothetical protein